MNKFFKRTTVERILFGCMAAVAVIALILSLYRQAEPIARSYNTDIYTEQGGSKMVVGSGGELEVQSGATLDIQSGATTDFSSGIDLDGSQLILDADGDSSIIASTDDVITITLGAATGDVVVDVGNFQVGHGSPGQTLDGDDFYVEGLAEIDGVLYVDGGADLNGTTLTVDADADSTIVASTDDVISVTLGAATGLLSVDIGNLSVGHGTPTQALDGDDLYVVGFAEIDGITYLEGGADLNGTTLTLDADADSTIVASDDDIITITLGAAAGDVIIDVGNLQVGYGSPGQTLDGDDLYVEGLAEFDGVVYLDGGAEFDTADLNGTILTMDADADTTIVASDDDVITITMGAAAGDVVIDVGNLQVGYGSPGQTLDGDDLYVEGLAEFDGVVYLDAGADLNGTTLTLDADADTTIVASDDDVITITLGAAAGDVIIDVGNLQVGYGSPGQTLDGDDFYVEGLAEFDGVLYADGGAEFNTADLNGTILTMDADADTTIVASDDDVITVTMGAAAGDVIIDVGNLQVGYGSPGQTLDGDDFYVEGLAEIDGVLYADGGADLNGTALTMDADADSIITASTDDVISITLGAANGVVGIDVGNLSIGHGTPGQSLDGDDLYVVGQMEVDGSAWLDSVLTIGGLLNLSFEDRATSDGDTITPTHTIIALDTGGAVTITLAASGTEGQLLILVNDDANACIIVDTNIASASGSAITLAAADDWVVFIYQDNLWHAILEVALS